MPLISDFLTKFLQLAGARILACFYIGGGCSWWRLTNKTHQRLPKQKNNTTILVEYIGGKGLIKVNSAVKYTSCTLYAIYCNGFKKYFGSLHLLASDVGVAAHTTTLQDVF